MCIKYIDINWQKMVANKGEEEGRGLLQTEAT